MLLACFDLKQGSDEFASFVAYQGDEAGPPNHLQNPPCVYWPRFVLAACAWSKSEVIVFRRVEIVLDCLHMRRSLAPFLIPPDRWSFCCNFYEIGGLISALMACRSLRREVKSSRPCLWFRVFGCCDDFVRTSCSQGRPPRRDSRCQSGAAVGMKAGDIGKLPKESENDKQVRDKRGKAEKTCGEGAY